MAEIFMSYQNDSKEEVYEYVHLLESRGLTCWVAPRDVTLTYASDIVGAICGCKVFIVFLTKKLNESVHVLNEIEQVYKNLKEGKSIIIPVYIEPTALSPAVDYYLARIQNIIAYDKTKEEVVDLIIEKINKAKVDSSAQELLDKTAVLSNNLTAEEMRVANRYYDVDDKYEKRRLKIEGEFLYRFEKKVVDELLEGKSHLNGLITCCMFAEAIMNKIDLSKFDKLIGFCYNERAVLEANYDYKNDHTRFYTQDCEDPELEDKLRRYMDEMDIDGFDYVDITMGFIDWKNPFKVIKTLKKFMNKDCAIFVRDVDDGVVMAYPDEGNLFRKFKTFYPLDPIAGYRRSGRRIFSYFKKIKAKSIEVKHKGISTTELEDDEEKEKLFHSFFGFIPNDFKISYNEDQTKSEYKAVIDWCDEHYDYLEETFMDDAFFYNSGYFILAIRM